MAVEASGEEVVELVSFKVVGDVSTTRLVGRRIVQKDSGRRERRKRSDSANALPPCFAFDNSTIGLHVFCLAHNKERELSSARTNNRDMPQAPMTMGGPWAPKRRAFPPKLESLQTQINRRKENISSHIALEAFRGVFPEAESRLSPESDMKWKKTKT